MERLGWLESIWTILSLGCLWDCCCSVTQSCLTLWGTMDCSTPGVPDLHYLLKFAQSHIHWVHDDIQPSHPLLPPSPPAFNLSQHQSLFQWAALCIRWSKYWSFSFSISPSCEHSGLISFKIDFFGLLAVQETLKSLLQHFNWFKGIKFFGVQPSLWSNSHIQGEISITSDMQMTPPLWQKAKKN